MCVNAQSFGKLNTLGLKLETVGSCRKTSGATKQINTKDQYLS